MVALLLACRSLLSGVFILAGVSKLKDPPGSRQSLIDFGVPELLAGPLARLLPIAEIGVAIGLLPRSFAWISATAAVGLLSLFVLAIAVSLARGRRPDCHCFGQIHSKPIGWGLAGRDLALAALGVIVISYGPRQPSFLIWMDSSVQFPGGSAFAAVVVALLILQGLAIFQLMRQNGRVLLRIEALEKRFGEAPPEPPAAPQGVPVGDPAPEFELPDLDGNTVSLRRLTGAGKPVVLLFVKPECHACMAMLPEAAKWQHDAANRFQVAVISQGAAEDNRAYAAKYGIRTFLLQAGQDVSDLFAARITPCAVVIRSDGVVASELVSGPQAIRSLISSILNESMIRDRAPGNSEMRLREGVAAPPLVFPDLDGRMFSLSQLGGKPSILLFWNPGCGFCQQMSNDVKTWEKKIARADTNMVLISTGTVEANRKQGFRSAIVLDRNFAAGTSFGASGTPSALLLDHQAKIVSKVAQGQKQIVEMIFRRAVESL